MIVPLAGGLQFWLLIATNCVSGALAAKLPRLSGCSRNTMILMSGEISFANISWRISNSNPDPAANSATKVWASANSIEEIPEGAAKTALSGAMGGIGVAVGGVGSCVPLALG